MSWLAQSRNPLRVYLLDGGLKKGQCLNLFNRYLSHLNFLLTPCTFGRWKRLTRKQLQMLIFWAFIKAPVGKEQAPPSTGIFERRATLSVF